MKKLQQQPPPQVAAYQGRRPTSAANKMLFQRKKKKVAQKQSKSSPSIKGTSLHETQLKENVSTITGTDVTDTQVHYNSDKPAQLQAEAYAQGNQVHLASGKEQHLGHELAHVAQQKEGRLGPVQARWCGKPLQPIQAKQKKKPVQKKEDSQKKEKKPVQAKTGTSTASSNSSGSSNGLPTQLKENMESMSGMDLSDVKVNYNSSKPKEMGALAYAQGNQIEIGPGQEKHLPHEAWHVVQQKQGRVKPTMQIKGKVNVNDDKGLEKEADVMGTRAMQTNNSFLTQSQLSNTKQTTQFKCKECEKEKSKQFKSNTPIQAQANLANMSIPMTAAAAVPWSYFWRAVSIRFAIRGTAGATLAAVDGPLPIGDLIAIGLGLWTIGEIISYWDTLWAEAEKLRDTEVEARCMEHLYACTGSSRKKRWTDCGACYRRCKHEGGVWPHSEHCPQ